MNFKYLLCQIFRSIRLSTPRLERNVLLLKFPKEEPILHPKNKMEDSRLFPISVFITSFLAFLFVFQFSYASTHLPMVDIKGVVVSKEANLPAVFSSISVFSFPEHDFITGTITDENGLYKISKLPLGKYFVEVSCVGFEKVFFEIQDEQNESNQIEKNIVLEPSTNVLSEVTVSDYLVKEKDEVDKTVFTVTDKMSEVSRDGIDVLKHIPGVTVDFQKNVTLEGSSNILYVVDGVERDKDFVTQLLPEDIDKIEIMTNPGVAYHSDVDAVISILLNRPPVGGRGHISGQIPNPQAIVGEYSGSIEYGTEKFRFYLNDYSHYEQFSAIIDRKTIMNHNDNHVVFSEKGEGIASWGNNSFNYGLDLFISKRSFLNIYGSLYNHLSNHKDYEQYGNLFINNQLNDAYLLELDKISAGNSFFNSIYFKHQLPENQNEISTQLNLYSYNSKTRNDYLYFYDVLDGVYANQFSFGRNERIDNNRNMLEWKTDFSGNVFNLNYDAGIMSYFQKFYNTYETTNLNQQNFPFQEFRQEAYFNLSGKFGELKYSGGVRSTFSKSIIQKENLNSYFDLMPQLSLQYVFANKSSLKMSGRRQIARPKMEQLNPFITQSDSLSIFRGNSELNPQFINKLEVQYAINYKSLYFAPKIFLNYSDNSIQNVSYVDPQGISVTQPQNIGSVLNVGVNLNASVGLSKWFKINGNTSLYRSSVSGIDNYNDTRNCWSVNGSAVVSPWKNTPVSFMISAQYHSPKLGYKTLTRRDLLLFAGVDAKFGKNFSASAYVIPLDFDFMYEGTETFDTNYYYSDKGKIHATYLFSINLTYKFSWGGELKKINRPTDYEKDGGGGNL